MNRYWISWHQPTEDYRPKSFPPNRAILGWWCSGYDENDAAVLCAVVAADRDEQAKAAVYEEWPEARGWRFIIPRAADFVPGDRFPLSDWMRERFYADMEVSQ